MLELLLVKTSVPGQWLEASKLSHDQTQHYVPVDNVTRKTYEPDPVALLCIWLVNASYCYPSFIACSIPALPRQTNLWAEQILNKLLPCQLA